MLGTCDLFRREDIQAVPFKGPVLAVQAYGNERLRHFSDIDFLVRPEDMRRARQCLMAQGYQWLNPVRPAGEDGYIRSGWPCMLEHDQRQCQIDLDTGVAPAYFAFAVPSAILWDRLETIVIGGQTVRTVTAQLAILLLCVHACKHQWRLLGYAADVAGLAARRSKDIEWPALVELARRLGGERMLLLGLALASDLGGVSLPDAVMRRIAADRPLGPVRAAAVQSMEREPGPRPGWVAEMRFHMKCRERYRDRVTYALRLVLTPGFSDWNAIGLPRGLRGFYRLAHVWRLVLKAFTPQQWERFRR
jgi:hypothetical protein